jgi:hypothetical protein
LIVPRKKRGIYADPQTTSPANLEDKVADFSYQNDSLADLIVECWTTQATLTDLTSGAGTARKDAAKIALAKRGIYLEFPIVVTEDEYEAGFHLAGASLPADKGVVFVIPRQARATMNMPLLETAKMLMAITPNGI